jgi:hypothetical protein
MPKPVRKVAFRGTKDDYDRTIQTGDGIEQGEHPMRRITTMSSGLILALACSVSGGEWNVRYAALPSVTEEQEDQGWPPNWKVNIEDTERPVIHMDDSQAGSAMGHALFGTVLEVLPGSFHFNVDGGP